MFIEFFIEDEKEPGFDVLALCFEEIYRVLEIKIHCCEVVFWCFWTADLLKAAIFF